MEDLRVFLDLLNETLAAAIVILAASMLLYNLSRNLQNRVARTSGVVLACVTLAYVSDVLVSLEPSIETREAILRLHWVGIVFIPAATFHLSDALLATTGLPSRGRRRRVAHLLYATGIIFLMLATFSEYLITAEDIGDNVSLRAGPLLSVFIAYYIPVNLIALVNVERARQRCLTRSTQRRMTYLLVAMLTPSIGVFPYSALLRAGDEFSIYALTVVNLANIIVIFMLLFLSYPLSFFGSRIPDRVVKVDLLRFMLRGPATGMLALATTIYIGPTTELMGIAGDTFLPFGVVATILIWQWGVDIVLPWLERHLIYFDEDDDQLGKIQNLSNRILTRADLLQLIEAVLEATCDYLQVNRAFIATLIKPTPEFIRSIGPVDLSAKSLEEDITSVVQHFNAHQDTTEIPTWGPYRVYPLFSRRLSDDGTDPVLIGLLGLDTHDHDQVVDDINNDPIFQRFIHRAERTLDDMMLHTEIVAALEGLLPQIVTDRNSADEIEYRTGRGGYRSIQATSYLPERKEVIQQVRAALRHYWGGPGLSSSRLLELQIVRDVLAANENNPARALRSVLQQAIDKQAPNPDESPDHKSPEWTLYNILTLRFVENRKARETAQRLFMSEANLYRKQNVAIEAVADALLEMEDGITKDKTEA